MLSEVQTSWRGVCAGVENRAYLTRDEYLTTEGQRGMQSLTLFDDAGEDGNEEERVWLTLRS